MTRYEYVFAGDELIEQILFRQGGLTGVSE